MWIFCFIKTYFYNDQHILHIFSSLVYTLLCVLLYVMKSKETVFFHVNISLLQVSAGQLYGRRLTDLLFPIDVQ